MGADPDDQEAVLARLARVVGSRVVGAATADAAVVDAAVPTPARRPPAAPGWVPGRPTPEISAHDLAGTADGGPDASDASDDTTAARRALSAAMASYTAAHGHPLAASEIDGPRRVRLGVAARVALGALVALALVVGVVALRAWQRAPSMTVPAAGLTTSGGSVGDDDGAAVPSGAAGATGAAGSTQPGVSTGAVVVHVVGEVASPGVVSLEPGARVADAVAAAGGATPTADLAAVNLARVLTDGEQVVVPAPGQTGGVGAGPGASGGASGSGGGLVDLNRADAAAFDTLPGIGPVLAERIVAWRDEHGRFTAVEELTEVSGIGPALLAGVRDLVQVG